MFCTLGPAKMTQHMWVIHFCLWKKNTFISLLPHLSIHHFLMNTSQSRNNQYSLSVHISLSCNPSLHNFEHQQKFPLVHLVLCPQHLHVGLKNDDCQSSHGPLTSSRFESRPQLGCKVDSKRSKGGKGVNEMRGSLAKYIKAKYVFPKSRSQFSRQMRRRAADRKK